MNLLKKTLTLLRPISFPGFQEIFYFPTFGQCVVKLLTHGLYLLKNDKQDTYQFSMKSKPGPNSIQTGPFHPPTFK
jgi:hypothetical protein